MPFKWFESSVELKKRREALGLSQNDLARASGVPKGTIATIESKENRPIPERIRHKLWEAIAGVEIEHKKMPSVAEGLRGLPAVPLASLLGEPPEQRFERELASLKRRARDLLRTHSSLAQTEDQMWELYKQDEARLTDYQKEIRLNTIEILGSTMRRLREDLASQVSTIEALSGAAGENPIEAEPAAPVAEEEKVSGD